MKPKHLALGLALGASTIVHFAGLAGAAPKHVELIRAPIPGKITLVQRAVPNASALVPRTDRFSPAVVDVQPTVVASVAAQVLHAVTETWMRPGVSAPAYPGLVELGRYDR